MPGPWWQPPRLRTGRDAEEERHATWLEIFYDLIFVVAIAQLASTLGHDVSIRGFARFVALFLPVWWAWVGATYYATRFDTDDTGHRLLTLAQIFAVAAMAVNASHALGATSVGFAVSYFIARFFLVIEYARAGRHVHHARTLTRRYGRGFALAAAFWLVSVSVPIPWRFVLWGVGIVIDFGTPLLAGQLHALLPPHTTHLPERFGLFTIIVLGESVADAVRGLATQHWLIVSTVTAMLGLAVAFGLWWIYFEGISGGAIKSAISGRGLGVYHWWIYAHLYLALGIAATGVGMERAVESAGGLLTNPERWLVCGGLAICFLALAVIHATTVCPTSEMKLRHEAGARDRAIAAAAVLILAAVGRSLPSVAVVAILTLICAAQVLLDFRERGVHERSQA